MQRTLLLCPPFYYDVEYELSTNRWMQRSDKPDKQRAWNQWLALYERCRHSFDWRVLLAPPYLDLPDMTFVANAGLPYRNLFILSNHFHQERRPESNAHWSFFVQWYGIHNVYALAGDEFFEGQGDAIWLDEKRLLVGYGVRTNLKGIQVVERVLHRYNSEVKVIPLPMKPLDQYPPTQKVFYHLDTCLCYLPHVKTFLLYADAFAPEALEILKSLGELCPVTHEEANNFVCNSVITNRKTILMPWADDSLRSVLRTAGYVDIYTFDMSEFMKSGGAVKCLILEI